MNKYEKALKELCSRCYVESEKCTCHPKYKGGKCNNNCEYKQALQELVDKENRMKEIQKGEDSYCPRCKALMMVKLPSYCWRCGQHLDWSDMFE